MLLDGATEPPRPIAVIPLGAAAESTALKLAERLRRAGHAVDLGYRGNLKRRMSRANKINARMAVILGDDELAQDSATVRDLDTGDQSLVPLDALDDRLSDTA
jgi:histidyl-tRNA synthetase